MNNTEPFVKFTTQAKEIYAKIESKNFTFEDVPLIFKWNVEFYGNTRPSPTNKRYYSDYCGE